MASCLCEGGLLKVVAEFRKLAMGGSDDDLENVKVKTSPPALESSAPPPPSKDGKDDVDLAGLSKNQRKKVLAREAKQERKSDKKYRRQDDALETALRSLSAALPEAASEEVAEEPEAPTRAALRRRFCSSFGIQGAMYRQLPRAFGPSAEEGLKAVGSMLLRPEKYGCKFLPQEYSLLHKLWAVLGGDCAHAGVLDIGAGNANCAVLAASLLGLPVICVERESPREELRAETQLPADLRQRVIRLESDVADFTLEQLQDVARANGLQRIVMVAKHPCGIGVDRSIEFASRLHAESTAARSAVSIVGVVLACCCTNKLSSDDARVSRVREFCDLYSNGLPSFADAGGQQNGASRLEKAVEIMSRCSAWRTASGSLGNAIGPEQLEWAELFEDALQWLRLERLRTVFGNAREVRFASQACTLQDRCLVATTAPVPAGVLAHGDAEDAAFLSQVREAAEGLLARHGPLDCRPKGLKSSKYDFDYTDEA